MSVVFIGMETSGALRNRFRALGFETYSCDLLPAEDEGLGHIVGDVFEVLDKFYAEGRWPDAAVFHPDCTYLTNSAAWAFREGPYHQKVKPGTLVGQARVDARERAVELVWRLRALKIRTKVIENPTGHLSARIGKPTQIVQPFEFGDDASKATCLWVYEDMELVKPERVPSLRLLPVQPKRYIAPTLRANGSHRWSNQTDTGQNRLSPGGDRWKDRARTYPGIADYLVDYIGGRLLAA